jgi:hypothetical protein
MKDHARYVMAKKTAAITSSEVVSVRPRGRPRAATVMSRPFSSRIRDDHAERLAEIAAETGKPQTRLLEEALTLYFQSLRKR